MTQENAADESKLSKLLNVFEAAALDLKTYSWTKIDCGEQVAELKNSLAVIAQYVDYARKELLTHINLLQSDQANTLMQLKSVTDRKSHYKAKYR